MQSEVSPSIKRRFVGFISFHFFFYLILIILSAPMVVSIYLLSLLGVPQEYNKNISLGIEISFIVLTLWIFAEEGMTLRHFIAGYSIKRKDGKMLNPIVLYLREIITYLTGLYIIFKIGMIPLLKRSINYTNEDKHYVNEREGKLYYSKKSVGEMQFESDINKTTYNVFNEIQKKGFLHDNLFSTEAHIVSRRIILRKILNFRKNNVTITTQN